MNPFPTKNLPETNQAGFYYFVLFFWSLLCLFPLLLSPLVISLANSVVPRLGEFWFSLPRLFFFVKGIPPY